MTTLQEQLRQEQRARIQRDMGPAGASTDPFSPGIAAPPAAVPTPPAEAAVPPAATTTPSAPPAPVAPQKTPAEIDAELGLPPPEAAPYRMPPEDAGTWDVIGAAWQKGTLNGTFEKARGDYSRALVEEMYGLLSPTEQAELDTRRPRGGRGGVMPWNTFMAEVIKSAEAAAARSPDAAARWARYPLTPEAFGQRIIEDMRTEDDAAQAILDQPGGGWAEFLGSAARSMTTPENIALTFLGGGSGSIARMVLTEAVLNGWAAAISLPGEFRAAEALNNPDPNAATRIATDFLVGGAFPLAIIGAGKGARALDKGTRALWARVQGRTASLNETRPEGVDRIDHEAGVEAAEAELRGDQTVEERLKGGARAEAAPGTMGDILGTTRSPDTVTVVEAYRGKTRNLPVSETFKADLRGAVAPLGDDIGVTIVSGGQDRSGRIPGSNRPIGGTRHDVDETGVAHTADVVLTRNGKPVTPNQDPELYAKFLYEAAKVYPGIGHYAWGVHVGGGSVASWGPDTTAKTLDPYFAQAIEAGRKGADFTAASGAAPVLPAIAPDAPPGWAGIRNGIYAGESGADPNALFNFQNRKGGKFSHIKPSEMTVDQWLEFQRPDGPYAQYVARNRPDPENGVATPMGAYQIVGDTLADLKRDLGLKGDEVMTFEFQDYLAQQIYLRQGTGAWVGYKGPRDNYTPGSVDGPAPSIGPTSRGYTGQGQVAVSDDMRIDVDYEVVDYRSLIRASGDLQPRDRSRINSDAWVSDTAARLDPAQLMPSPTADRGTPIVGPDNVIESGNGRSMAIARAYERHPDRAEAYKGAIEAAGYQIPDGVEQPVLIARRRSDLTPDQRRQMVIDAQDSGVAQMTPTEVARATSRNLGSSILSRLDPSAPLASDANGGFVRAALATLPRSARNAMFDAGGALNANGQRQLKEALFARAWDAPDILARYTEGAPAELKSLIEALETAAPSWATLRAEIEAGLVAPEMDISPFVLDAMRLIGAARDLAAKGTPMARAIAELLDEVDLMQGAVSPLTTALVRKMWRNGRAAPADEIASFLTRYADDARKAGAAGGMFDAPSPRDVLRTIDPETFKDLPEDFGQARGFARPGSEAPPEAVRTLPDQGFNEGARSPEAEAVHAEIEAELRGPDAGQGAPSGTPAGTAPAANPSEAISRPSGEALAPIDMAALALDRARRDLGEFAAVEIDLPDGTRIRAGDMLDDLDADRATDAFLQACATSSNGAPT